MDPLRLRNLLSRKRRASTSEKKEKPDKQLTQGAHELFLGNEGFLSPTRPPRPSTSVSSLAASHSSRLSNGHTDKQSEEALRFSASRTRSHKSFSSHADTVVEFPSLPLRATSSRKQALFSFRGSAHEQPKGRPDEKAEWPLRNDPEPDPKPWPTTSSWLRRLMSTASRQTRSPPPSFTPGYHPPTYTMEAPYYRYSIYDDDNLTALPSFSDRENGPRKMLEEKIAKGAAARAAVAAQNELYESIRNMRLGEARVTRDSESGVGIEVRDRGEVMSDTDIPVVRKGKDSKMDHGEARLTL